MLSAIVPTLNAQSTICECLDGLSGADELIVVDGGRQALTVDHHGHAH